MKTYFSILFLTLIMSQVRGQDLEVTLDIIEENEEPDVSNAVGDFLFQYNNYKLHELISKVYNIPKEFIQFENIKTSPTVSFQIKSETVVLNEDIIRANLEKIVLEKLMIEISAIEKEMDLITMEIDNSNVLDKCTPSDYAEGILEQKQMSNGTFNGTCISSNDLIEVIKNWYYIIVFNEVDPLIKFNISMQQVNSFKEFSDEMEVFNGIKFSPKAQRVKALIVSQL